jgi:hypothetical protein
MTTPIKIPLLFFATLFISCSEQTIKSKRTAAVNETSSQEKNTKQVGKPVLFRKNYNGENNKLFVFVGEKISVEQMRNSPGAFDNGFIAKYLIIKKVFGQFSQDTIEFTAYDHYGIPAFSKFKNVLLFVSADSGFYYQQKYMYNDVYITKDRKWAGTYAEEDYGHEYNKKTKVKPVIIDFAMEVSYPTKVMKPDSEVVTFNYPKPYFKTIGDKAIAVYGNYVDELFILKRDGYLTAREIFKSGKLQ